MSLDGTTHVIVAGVPRVLAARRSDVHPTASPVFGRGRVVGGIPTPTDEALLELHPLLQSEGPSGEAPLPDSPPCDIRTLLPLAAHVRNQGSDDKCEGMATSMANFLAVGCKGAEASQDGIWTDARSREVARGVPLTNVGCQTSDVYDAICSTGMYPRDARDDSPDDATSRDTIDEAIARKPIDPLLLEPLDDGDTTSLNGWLQRGMCCTFTMPVTPAYAALSSAAPVLTDLSGKSLGFHRQVCVGRAIVNGVLMYVVMNSWGLGFADGGFAYIPVGSFASLMLEAVVHKGGVLL